jgi:8-oxo-dGTP diphosphatase
MKHEEWIKSIQQVGVVVGCLIFENGKYLLVQEKQQKAYKLWNVPAGHVDKDEGLEAAAIREVKEETGLNVNLIKELAIYHEEADRSIKHVYLATVTGGELKARENEILDIKWLSYNEIQDLNKDGKLRKPWVWNVINSFHNNP